MPPYKIEKKDTRTPEEIAIQAASTSRYRLCQPLWNAENIRITDPLTRLDKTYRVGSEQFYERVSELFSLGLREKITSELDSFASEIDPKWGQILEAVNKRYEEGIAQG